MTAPTKRAKVRNQVAALLKAGVAEVGGRVYRARTWPLKEAALPALLVYGYDEEKELASAVAAADATYSVKCQMVVQARVARLAAESEQAEEDLEVLCGSICDLVLTSVELRAKDDSPEALPKIRTTLKVELQGDHVVAEAMLAFEIQWSERYSLPEPAIDCDDAYVVFAPVAAPP